MSNLQKMFENDKQNCLNIKKTKNSSRYWVFVFWRFKNIWNEIKTCEVINYECTTNVHVRTEIYYECTVNWHYLRFGWTLLRLRDLLKQQENVTKFVMISGMIAIQYLHFGHSRHLFSSFSGISADAKV